MSYICKKIQKGKEEAASATATQTAADIAEQKEEIITGHLSYYTHLGSEFAAGYLFGINAGMFNIDELHKCLMFEPMSDMVLQAADALFKKSLQRKGQNGLKTPWGAQALSQLANFVYEMAMERNINDSKHACLTITKDGDLTDELKILGLLTHKDTKLHSPEDGVLTFNNQDIS